MIGRSAFNEIMPFTEKGLISKYISQTLEIGANFPLIPSDYELRCRPTQLFELQCEPPSPACFALSKQAALSRKGERVSAAASSHLIMRFQRLKILQDCRQIF